MSKLLSRFSGRPKERVTQDDDGIRPSLIAAALGGTHIVGQIPGPAAPPRSLPDGQRVWHLDTPAEWEQRLREREGEGGSNMSRLRLFFHPGYARDDRPQHEAEVVERWVLYQLIPAQFTYPIFVRQHDRRLPEGCTRPVFELEFSLLDNAQRQLFRETGLYAQPLWCLQGSQGGQPWRYTQSEKLMCRTRGLPDRPVPPGDLDPCPLDGRVMDALAAHDRFLQWEFIADTFDRAGARAEKDEVEAMREARRQFWDWSEERQRGALAELSRRDFAEAADELSSVRRISTRQDRLKAAHYAPDLDRAKHDFIHSA